MATIWLTYAWVDNAKQDVDFVAQELEESGLSVKLDRWNLTAGKRLWEQISDFIENPDQCDAWLLYATPNSLGSEACREEFAYALDRALSTRRTTFPVIGLFPSTVNQSLIPAGIRSRLYVSTRDPDWKERIKAAAENRVASVERPRVEPVYMQIHPFERSGRRGYGIELRPRDGSWPTFFAGVPSAEKERVNMNLGFGPAGKPPAVSVMVTRGKGFNTDGQWWCELAQSEATPMQSYYVFCDELPSRVNFGLIDAQPQYTVTVVPLT